MYMSKSWSLLWATASFGPAAAVSIPRSTLGSPVSSWTNATQDLFSQAMTFLDSFYDKRAGYLYDLSSAAGLRHESRQSVFYALGLLARNDGSDADEAAVILNNIVAGQFTDPESGAYVFSPSTSPSVTNTSRLTCVHDASSSSSSVTETTRSTQSSPSSAQATQL